MASRSKQRRTHTGSGSLFGASQWSINSSHALAQCTKWLSLFSRWSDMPGKIKNTIAQQMCRHRSCVHYTEALLIMPAYITACMYETGCTAKPNRTATPDTPSTHRRANREQTLRRRGETQGHCRANQPLPPTRALRSFCEHLHGKDSWLTCSIAAIKPVLGQTRKGGWGPNGGRIFLHLSRGTFLCTLRLPTSKSSRATSAL